ncbi:biliverdin-producing heme oxygenase [Aquimarina addita]
MSQQIKISDHQSKSILEILKAGTALSHQEAEKKNLAKKIIDHTISLEEYKKLLFINWKAYRSIEQYLYQNKHILPNELTSLVSYDKSNRLQKDLNALGVLLDHSQENSISCPENSSVDSLIGFLYVIEGSMLGGMLIAKHISQCPSLEHIRNPYFFSGKSKDQMKNWKEFCMYLNNQKYTESNIQKALDAANKAFTFFS